MSLYSVSKHPANGEKDDSNANLCKKAVFTLPEGKTEAITLPDLAGSALEEAMESVGKDVQSQAETIISKTFPAKVLALTKFLENIKNTRLPASQNVVAGNLEANSKKRKLNAASEPSDAIPCCRPVVEMVDLLKVELTELIEYCGTVKLWIQLNIPKIEDGNNFGVSVQEEIVNELSRAEDSAFGILEGMTKYFVTRARLVSKSLKYPQIDDFSRSIVELDEKEFLNMQLCLNDLRKNYFIIFDILTKNMEKLKKPRSQNHSSMY